MKLGKKEMKRSTSGENQRIIWWGGKIQDGGYFT
jgi:hypothetical protein